MNNKYIYLTYNPRASEKIRINIIPTNTLSDWPNALTPASPPTPIAIPAANELRPQHKPEAKCLYALYSSLISPGASG